MSNSIQLFNSKYSLENFELDAENNIKITGIANFADGVTGNLSINKETGKTVTANFDFDIEKFDDKTAQEWLDNYSKTPHCIECLEKFDTNDDIFITAKIGKLNEPMNDGRIITDMEIPKNKDIIFRDGHRKKKNGYFGKVLGIANSNNVIKNKKDEFIVKWKVVDKKFKELIHSSVDPLNLFNYSQELSPFEKDGNKRKGVLDAVAVTLQNSWHGAKNIKMDNFENEQIADIETFDELGDIMTDDLKIKLNDQKHQIESFETEIKSKNDEIESFEKENANLKAEIETFETKIKDQEDLISAKDAEIETFESKIKTLEADNADMKTDLDAKKKTIETFETEKRNEKILETFDKGVKAGVFKEDDKDSTIESMQDLSIDRLNERTEDFDTIIKNKKTTEPKNKFKQTKDKSVETFDSENDDEDEEIEEPGLDVKAGFEELYNG